MTSCVQPEQTKKSCGCNIYDKKPVKTVDVLLKQKLTDAKVVKKKLFKWLQNNKTQHKVIIVVVCVKQNMNIAM